MKISVIINTYNRCQSLARTLRSLEFQTFGNFEVIVVNGPSTDATEAVLATYQGRLRAGDCPERNLAVSRNIGIDHASGDVVAFIDDDSLATPRWLEQLAAGYTDSKTGGAGGLVYDHTGRTLQYRYSHCARTGIPDFEKGRPEEGYNCAGADPFVYLQGTNCSFRREVLERIGGFDEEFEYYLDETDVCMRVLDAGFRLAAIDGGIVHHKYLSSFLRTPERLVLDPFSSVKNTHYFALQNHRRCAIKGVDSVLQRYVDEVTASAYWFRGRGKMTVQQRDFFLRRVKEAVAEGRRRGAGERRTRAIRSQQSADFLPFPTIACQGERRTFCFISKEYPPGDYGGNGRHTYDLATTFAGLGHEVHVITNSTHDEEYVDIEDDVWVHRLVERPHPAVEGHLLCGNISLIARNYRELARIHRESPVSLAIAPIWLCEGAMAACDPRFPTVMTLMTTTRVLLDLNPEIQESAHIRHLVLLEQASVAAHRYFHAISRAIAKRVDADYQLPKSAFVAPLGIGDMQKGITSRQREDGGVRVLFVGRIERRKAVDTLLAAVERILPEFPQAELHLVGKTNQDGSENLEGEFRARHQDRPDILRRVKFLGMVDQADLQQQYLDADIFCLPSRYESFGLVLLEAMAVGKPVVASRVGGIPEVVDEGKTGLLFEKDNVSELADSLRRLIADPVLRCLLGAQGRVRFETVFDLPVIVDGLRVHYEQVIADHRANEPVTGEAVEETLRKRFTEVLVHSMEIDPERAEAVAMDLLVEPPSHDETSAAAFAALKSTALWRVVRWVSRQIYNRYPYAFMEMRVRLLPHLVSTTNRFAKIGGYFRSILPSRTSLPQGKG